MILKNDVNIWPLVEKIKNLITALISGLYAVVLFVIATLSSNKKIMI